MSKWIAKKDCFYLVGEVKKGQVAESVIFFKEGKSNCVDVMLNGVNHKLLEEIFINDFDFIEILDTYKESSKLFLSRKNLNRIKYRGRNFGLKQYEVKALINHYEEKYRQLKEVLNVKDQIIATFNNNVKLPKEVADWLVEKKFISILELETELIFNIDDENYPKFLKDYIIYNDEAITNIIDAYRYGWEVE